MYLMPDNNAWHDDHFKFEAGQYNNWLDALLSEDKTSLALMIFVSEIFEHSDYLNQVQSDFDSVKDKFSLIEHSLSKYPKRPLILCTHIPYLDSNISNARLADIGYCFELDDMAQHVKE